MISAVVYLCALASIWVALIVHPEHSLRGYPSGVLFLTLMISGVVLSLNAL
jgi:hypothetical protein